MSDDEVVVSAIAEAIQNAKAANSNEVKGRPVNENNLHMAREVLKALRSAGFEITRVPKG